MAAKILSFADIVGANDVPAKLVSVPEWGGAVRVKGMTKREQQTMRGQATGADGKVDATLMETLMLAHCLAEPKVTIEEAGQLLDKSAAVVDKILSEIMDITGLSEASQKGMVRTFHAGDEGPEAQSE